MNDEEKKEPEQEEPEPVRQFDGCCGCTNEGPQCMGCIDAPRDGINFW